MYERELKKLKALCEGGLYKSPFYARQVRDAAAFDSYESFCKIPFMYKDDIRSCNAYDRTSAEKGEVFGIFSSSGTTGEKTFYVYNKTDKKVHEAFVKDFFTEFGVDSGDLGGVFAPVDTGVMAHSMMWQFTVMGAGYVTCVQPSPENMIDFVTKLPVSVVATRPSVVCSIVGNPEFEEKAQKSHVRLMLLGGGFLTEGRRKVIEKAWGATCYGLLGMSEIFGPIAAECKHKDGLHYPSKYLLVEVVDPVTHLPVSAGEAGVAVYTTLWNKGFPILRYWTDDIVRLDNRPCACGRKLPRIRYLGRLADCFTVDGKYVFPAMLEECLFKYGFTGEYRARREGDKITVILEKISGYEVSSEMKSEIDGIFMRDVEIEFRPSEEMRYDGHAVRFENR
ncbi:MAG: phenylacetate--CoA ligase family protein [Clostridiales bacterium]|nr:phenylacetate--CoA ligase family protein [Clostridiales bacterium]